MFWLLVVSFGASAIGALFGIGGGVIIRPILDLTSPYSVAVVHFLSSATVLAMSAYSVGAGLVSKRENHIDFWVSTSLGISAAIGGILGSMLFGLVLPGENAGMIQSLAFVAVMGATFVFMIYKSKVTPLEANNIFLGLPVGLSLGVVSSFLGIGGGPINLAVLYYFYGMNAKTAAQNSLYIIFISQAFALLTNLVGDQIPDFPPVALIFMILGGICGGMVGRKVGQIIKSATAERLAVVITGVVLVIGLVNLAV